MRALRLVGLRQQHDEFVAAVSRGKVGVAQLLADGIGEGDDGAISRRMAELVVDLLEAVEVDHRAGEGVPIAVGARNLLFQARVEGAEVGQPRQAVGLRERAEVLLLRGELERAIDSRHQLLLAERLGQVVGRAEREALRLRLGVALGREEDHRRVRRPRVAPQPGERAESVHSGEEQIEEHQVGTQLGGALERRLPIADRVDVIAGAQQLGEQHAGVFIVFHHQDQRLVPLPPRWGRFGCGRLIGMGYPRRPDPGGDSSRDFVGAAACVVGAGLDRGGGVIGENDDRSVDPRQLAHGDRPRQIVEGADERRWLAGALDQPHARQRFPQRLRDVPSPHDPDVHAVSPKRTPPNSPQGR